MFEDSSAPIGSFDAGDKLVSREQWPGSVLMVLPASPSPLADPITTGNVTDAWSVPLPDTGAAWGTDLRGVMTTPQGLIMSAEATPVVIGLGVIVFHDDPSGTVAVGVDGRAGSVRIFRLNFESAWVQL